MTAVVCHSLDQFAWWCADHRIAAGRQLTMTKADRAFAVRSPEDLIDTQFDNIVMLSDSKENPQIDEILEYLELVGSLKS